MKELVSQTLNANEVSDISWSVEWFTLHVLKLDKEDVWRIFVLPPSQNMSKPTSKWIIFRKHFCHVLLPGDTLPQVLQLVPEGDTHVLGIPHNVYVSAASGVG